MAMQSPGGTEVGRLQIRVVADTSGMRDDIRKAAAGIKDAKVEVHADTLTFEEEMQTARAEAGRGTVTIEVDTELNAKNLREKVRAVVKQAEQGRSIKIPVELQDVNRAAIRANLMGLQQRVRDQARGWKPVDIIASASETEERVKAALEAADKKLRNWEMRAPFVVGANLRVENLRAELVETQALLDAAGLNVDVAVRMKNNAVTHGDLTKMDQDWSNFLTTLRQVEHEQKVGEAGWDEYAARFKRSVAEADHAHKAFMERIEQRNERVGVWAEIFGRKLQLAFGSIALSALTAGLASTVGYLGAGAVNAVALAGGIAQAAGAAVMLPGLMAGTAAAIGVAVIGFQGFGSALKEIFAAEQDPEKLAKALEALTPAARSAAEAVGALKPAFKAMKESIQESMFAGLDQGIAKLDGFIAKMTPALSAIATGWNSTFKGLLGGLSSDTTIAGLTTGFQNFGTMMTNFASGLPSLVQGFATLTGASSKFFASIGSYGAEQMREFEGWVNRISTDGSLERWVSNAKSAFSDMWAIVKNVSSGLAAVFSVAGGAAFLGDIREMTFEFKQFAQSAEGMDVFGRVFADARSIVMNVTEALRPLGPMFVELVSGVENFTGRFAAAFGPAMKNGEQAMHSFMTAIGNLAEPIAKILGSAVEGIGSISSSVGPALVNLGNALAPFIVELSNFASGAGGIFINALTGLLTVVNTLASAVPGLTSAMGGFFAVMYGAKVVTELVGKLGLLNGAAALTVGKMGQLAGPTSAAGLSLTAMGSAAGGATSKMGKLGGAITGFIKSAGPLLGLGLAAGVYEMAKALSDRLNPALNDAVELNDALPGKINAATEAMKNGAQGLSTTLKQISGDYKELGNKQVEAAQQMQNGFLNNATFVGAAGKMAEDSLAEAGSVGEIFAKTAAKLAYDVLPPLAKAQGAVADAQTAFNKAAGEFGLNSPQAAAAALTLAQAQWSLATATDAANLAQQTSADKAKDQAEAQSLLISLDGQAAAARLNVTAATDQYNQAVAESGVSSDQAKVAMGNLQAAMQTQIETAGALASAQAVATGASDGSAASYQAQHDTLWDLSQTMTGPAQQAALTMLNSLQTNQAAAILGAQGFDDLGGAIFSVPDSKSVVVSDNSGVIEQKMKDLGFTVEHLPGGNIKITATDNATGTAYKIASGIDAIQASINVSVNYLNSASPYASGGRVDGPGTETSDSIPAMLSRNEYVIKASAARTIGYDNLAKLNAVSGTREATRLVGDITGKFAEGGRPDDWFRNAAAKAAEEFRSTNFSADVVVPGRAGVEVVQYITSATVESDSELVNRGMNMARMLVG